MLHAIWHGAEAFPIAEIMAAVGDGYTWATIPKGSDEKLFRGLANAEVLITNRFTAEMAGKAGNLRFLQCYTSGYDGIDLSAIPEGVTFSHLAGHESAVAEHALSLWLAVAKQIVPASAELTRHRWSYGFVNHGPYSREVRGSTVGLVGLGGIGTAFAQMVQGLEPRILAVRAHPEYGAPVPVEKVWGPEEYEQILPQSDVLVLAAPLTAGTKRLIGWDQLRQMKPSAILVNVARGGLLDHQALYEALTGGLIAGAGLDVPVFHPPQGRETAPFGDIPLERLPNVVATPHMGAWTISTLRRRNQQLVEHLQAFRDGRPVGLTVVLKSRP